MTPLTEILTRGVFLAPDAYSTMPITLPFVVRDFKCRGGSTGARGDREAWGSPDPDGYMRDDNTMVKGQIRSMTVSSTGRRLGSGYTAAHVWRVVNHQLLASRIPLLYSFVPNVVWLPTDLAKLTDHEGGSYQRALQNVSWAVYRQADVDPSLQGIAAEAWELLPTPTEDLSVAGEQLNTFVPNPRTAGANLRRIRTVISALDDINRNIPLPGRVICSRYAAGLPLVPEHPRRQLRQHLQRFVSESAERDNGAGK